MHQMSNKQQYVNDLLNIIICPLFEEFSFGLWMTRLNLLPSVDLQTNNITVINVLCKNGPTIHERILVEKRAEEML